MTDVLLVRLDGTAGAIEADAIRALMAYTGGLCDVRWVLACGCGRSVECGYHREQTERLRGDTA